MGFKVFIAGQEALAADVNDYLMEQTVARFPSAANRSANLPSPAVNQLSMLNDRPAVIQAWNGSAWIDATSITPSGYAPFVQYGSTVVTTDPYGSANITFPLPFTSAADRRVLVNNGDANALSAPYSFWAGILAGSHTASGVTAVCTNTSGPIASTIVRVDWIAIGVKP